MQLPDGTLADVIDLVKDGDTVVATVAVVWAGGPKATAQVSFTPSMVIQAVALTAPGMIRPAPPVRVGPV